MATDADSVVNRLNCSVNDPTPTQSSGRLNKINRYCLIVEFLHPRACVFSKCYGLKMKISTAIELIILIAITSSQLRPANGQFDMTKLCRRPAAFCIGIKDNKSHSYGRVGSCFNHKDCDTYLIAFKDGKQSTNGDTVYTWVLTTKIPEVGRDVSMVDFYVSKDGPGQTINFVSGRISFKTIIYDGGKVDYKYESNTTASGNPVGCMKKRPFCVNRLGCTNRETVIKQCFVPSSVKIVDKNLAQVVFASKNVINATGTGNTYLDQPNYVHLLVTKGGRFKHFSTDIACKLFEDKSPDGNKCFHDQPEITDDLDDPAEATDLEKERNEQLRSHSTMHHGFLFTMITCSMTAIYIANKIDL